jgi:hypothetical protein
MTTADSFLLNESESTQAQVIEKNHFPSLENRPTVALMRSDFWLMCMAAALAVATLAPVALMAA